jgi:hypothetical protein
LVIIDAGSSFASMMEEMCNHLRIPYHKVLKENHQAILAEHFHQYLNKVQTINSADVQDLTQWMHGTLFTFYAWNASPVDATDII